MESNITHSIKESRLTVLSLPVEHEAVSNSVFWIYIYFLLDFFLHLSHRIPGYGVIRPTLLLTLVISIMLYSQRRKIAGYGTDFLTKSIVALIIYILITLPVVEWPGSVVKNNLPEFVKAVVFFFFTSLVVDSERRLIIFLKVFVSCQVFRVLEPLFLHVTTGYWGSSTYLGVGEGFAGRLAGSPYDVINPNELGFVIVTSIPFLHYLLSDKSLKMKFLYFGLLSLLMYALILTMSRGSFLALIVIAWMIFRQSNRKFLLIMGGIIIIFGAYSVMTPIQKDRYFGMLSSDSKSSKTIDGRIRLIKKEFMLGFERPIVGHGVGTTPEAKTHKWGRVQASHNMYGELLIEIGIIGAFIFLRYMVGIGRSVKENREILEKSDLNKTPSIFKDLNRIIAALFWMYILYSLNYWGLSQYYWYLLGGMVVAYGRLLRQWKNQYMSESVENKYAF